MKDITRDSETRRTLKEAMVVPESPDSEHGGYPHVPFCASLLMRVRKGRFQGGVKQIKLERLFLKHDSTHVKRQ